MMSWTLDSVRSRVACVLLGLAFLHVPLLLLIELMLGRSVWLPTALAFGMAAAAITYGIGRLIGVTIGG